MRTRISIVLLFDRGFRSPHIAEVLGRAPATVVRVAHRFLEHGEDGLEDGRRTNWSEYEAGLHARGGLTACLGLTDGKLADWDAPRPKRRKPGRQPVDSDRVIETAVALGMVFGLAARQTEVSLRSSLELLSLRNEVLDHTTISRHKAKLGKLVFHVPRDGNPATS